MIGTHVIDISDGSLKTAQDLLDSHFKGLHASALALVAAYPIGVSGDYANVDAGGTGTQTERYIWDVDDAVWRLGSSGGLDHTHTNKAILDATSASFTTADEAKVDKFTLSTDLVAIPDGFRPGLFTGAGAPSGSIFESAVDGHLWFKHRDDTLHLLCDTSPYGSGAVWGTITGTLSNQTDLNTALLLKADVASPALTGIPTAPTATQGTSTTQIATTAFTSIGLAAKAPLASPSLTGVPTAPTAIAGIATDQIATTAFVDAATSGSHTHTLADITNSGALAALNSVTAIQIDSNAVTTAKIIDDAVTADKIADTAVTAGVYSNADITVDAQGRITSAANGSASATTWGSITGTLANQTDLGTLAGKNSVATAEIDALAVTTAEIAANAVTTAKILDANVTTPKILDANVTAAKLAATAVAAGSYTNADLTVDAQGRITSCTNGSSSATTWGTITGTLSNQTDLGTLAGKSTVATTDIDNDSVTADKLADTAVTAGSYTSTNITVDAQGRITSASSGSGSATIGYVSTANSPGLTVSGDTNTGLYSDALDLIGASAGGMSIWEGLEINAKSFFFVTADSISSPGSGTGSEQYGYDSVASGLYSTALGYSADATGTSATAIGFGTSATAANGTAYGSGSHADHGWATMLGASADSLGTYCVGVGYNAQAGANTVSVGALSSATSTGGVAVGKSSTAGGTGAVSIGENSQATNQQNVSIGVNTDAITGYNATAVGGESSVTGSNSTLAGAQSFLTGAQSSSLGSYTTNTHAYSVCLGYYAISEDDNALTLGGKNSALAGISRIYFGHGCTSAHAGVAPSRLWATSGSGTNIGGTDLELAGGSPTGSGSGGEVRILTAPAGASGTTLRTLQNRMTIKENGDIDCHYNDLLNCGKATFTGPVMLQGAGAPITSTSAGVEGQIAWSSYYLFICVADNSWKRIALSAF